MSLSKRNSAPGRPKITPRYFQERTGHPPRRDDMERVRCEIEGIGHMHCGWCWEHDRPRFECGCIQSDEPKENPEFYNLTKAEMLADLGDDVVKSKKEGRNTVRYWLKDGTEALRYVETDVVTIHPDGGIELDSGGFKTQTTMRRINGELMKIADLDLRVWQKSAKRGEGRGSGDLMLRVEVDRRTVDVSKLSFWDRKATEEVSSYENMLFVDGMIIYRNGVILVPGDEPYFYGTPQSELSDEDLVMLDVALQEIQGLKENPSIDTPFLTQMIYVDGPGYWLKNNFAEAFSFEEADLKLAEWSGQTRGRGIVHFVIYIFGQVVYSGDYRLEENTGLKSHVILYLEHVIQNAGEYRAEGIDVPTESDAEHLLGILSEKNPGIVDPETGAFIPYSQFLDEPIEFEEEILSEPIEENRIIARDINDALLQGTVGIGEHGLVTEVEMEGPRHGPIPHQEVERQRDDRDRFRRWPPRDPEWLDRPTMVEDLIDEIDQPIQYRVRGYDARLNRAYGPPDLQGFWLVAEFDDGRKLYIAHLDEDIYSLFIRSRPGIADNELYAGYVNEVIDTADDYLQQQRV